MARNLFVAGLPWEVTSDDLGRLFGPSGTVVSAKVLTERDTGRSRGLGFVEMSSEDEARSAIRNLNGSQVGGRTIFVSEARPKEGGGTYAGPERRSGKDRRANPPAARKPWEKTPAFGEKKPWSKPWEKKDAPGGHKPWEKKGSEGARKKWGAGGPGGGRKPGDSFSKPGGFKRKPGGGFRGR